MKEKNYNHSSYTSLPMIMKVENVKILTPNKVRREATADHNSKDRLIKEIEKG